MIHVEREWKDGDSLDTVTMRCGITVVACADGSLWPSLDFVSAKWPQNGTCPNCALPTPRQLRDAVTRKRAMENVAALKARAEADIAAAKDLTARFEAFTPTEKAACLRQLAREAPDTEMRTKLIMAALQWDTIVFASEPPDRLNWEDAGFKVTESTQPFIDDDEFLPKR